MTTLFFFPKSQTRGYLSEVDPRVKILVFIALILGMVLTSPLEFLKFGLFFALLFFLIIQSRVSWKPIIFRILLVSVMIVFIGVIVLIFQRRPVSQNLMVMWNISVKTICVVVSLSLLTQTTEFYRLIKALESLRVPRLFVSLLGFTYRYLQLLYDEIIRVKRAIDSRSFGKKRKMENVKLLEKTLVHVFLRTFDRSERIYAAMLSRGYDGTLSTMDFLSLKKKDFVFAGVIAVFLLVVLVLI